MSATRDQRPVQDEDAAWRASLLATHRYALRATRLRGELDELAGLDAGPETERPSVDAAPPPRIEPSRAVDDASPRPVPPTSRLLTLVVMPFVFVYLALKSVARTVLSATPRVVEALGLATISLLEAGGRVFVAAVDGVVAVIDVTLRGLTWLGRRSRAILAPIGVLISKVVTVVYAVVLDVVRRVGHVAWSVLVRIGVMFRAAGLVTVRGVRIVGGAVGEVLRVVGRTVRELAVRAGVVLRAIAHELTRPLRALGRMLRELGSRVAVLGRAAGHALATAIRAVARSIGFWLRVLGGAIRQLFLRAGVLLRALGHELMRPIRWAARGAVAVVARVLALARGATRAVFAFVRAVGSRLRSLAELGARLLREMIRRASPVVIAALETFGTVVAVAAILVAAGARVVGLALAPTVIALLRAMRRVGAGLVTRTRIAFALVRGFARTAAHATAVTMRAVAWAARDAIRRIVSPIAQALRRAGSLVRMGAVALGASIGAAGRAIRHAVGGAVRPVRAAIAAAGSRIRTAVTNSTLELRRAMRSATTSVRAAASEARSVARSLMHRPTRPGPTGGVPPA
jgi:hypothetical protein